MKVDSEFHDQGQFPVLLLLSLLVFWRGWGWGRVGGGLFCFEHFQISQALPLESSPRQWPVPSSMTKVDTQFQDQSRFIFHEVQFPVQRPVLIPSSKRKVKQMFYHGQRSWPCNSQLSNLSKPIPCTKIKIHTQIQDEGRFNVLKRWPIPMWTEDGS